MGRNGRTRRENANFMRGGERELYVLPSTSVRRPTNYAARFNARRMGGIAFVLPACQVSGAEGRGAFIHSSREEERGNNGHYGRENTKARRHFFYYDVLTSPIVT